MNQAADLSAAHVQAFCNEVVANAQPCTVQCKPHPGGAMLDCFATVDAQVQKHGGRRVDGWAVWEVPGILIEAEFHAVWANPEGGLLTDVVNRDMPFAQITFLPDPVRQYMGRQVDNVRKPLTADTKVKQLVYLMRRRFELMNTGTRAEQHLLTLSNRESKEIEALHRQIASLAKRVFR